MSDWIKEDKNPLSSNYQVVKSPTNGLHFYAFATNKLAIEEIDGVVDDLVALLNFGTKSPRLRRSVLLDEVVILKNSVTIGVAGAVTKIKAEKRPENESCFVNNDRVEFLKNLVDKF